MSDLLEAVAAALIAWALVYLAFRWAFMVDDDFGDS
jgi:hypothetical protein